MLLSFLVFLVGSAILYLGAEWLIRGASAIAIQRGIRPFVVGLTVVALGTSLPEFVVNIVASVRSERELALGNIIGSNISNIGLIIGITAVLMPLVMRSATIRKEYPIMMFVMGLFYLLALDGVIDRWNGLLLAAGFGLFILYLVRDIQKNPQEAPLDVSGETEAAPPARTPWWKMTAFIVAGMMLLMAGAHIMVQSAVQIAEFFGVSRTVIGLTVVAIGTSLPELASSIVAVMKGEGDLSIGNVLGSNLFNVLFVVGFVSLITPLPVDRESLWIHFPVMMFFGLLILPMALIRRRLGRIDGSVLLILYVAYIVFLIWPYV